MQLADPANRDAVAEDVGRASRVAPDRLRGPVVETGAGQRSHAFEIALQVVEINRAAGLAPLRIGDIAAGRRSHPQRLQRRRALFRFRSEEHTSELQSLTPTSYAVFCLKK